MRECMRTLCRSARLHYCDLLGHPIDSISRVAGVVGQIIKAPVRFLENLVAGIKGGILKFKDNILGHLRKGLMSWLGEGNPAPEVSIDPATHLDEEAYTGIRDRGMPIAARRKASCFEKFVQPSTGVGTKLWTGRARRGTTLGADDARSSSRSLHSTNYKICI